MADFLPVSIPPGVVKGATPLDAKGRWWDANLVRWRSGVMEPVRGWEKLITTALPSRIRKIDQWRTNANDLFKLVGTNQKIYVESDGTYVDVTPTGLATAIDAVSFTGFGVNEYGDEGYGIERSTPSTNINIVAPFWTVPNWGEDKLATFSVDGKLYYYDVTTPLADFAVVAGAPVNNISCHVTPERHVMLLQVGGNPRRVGWSSRENHTDWNFASTTNTAGYLDLETATPLVKAANSRAGTLVFSYSDVFLMPWVGVPYVYGQQWLGQTRLLGADTIVTDNGSVFWWATDGFKMFDGGAVRTLECPLWDYIMSRTDPNSLRVYAHGGSLGLLPEIWWFYPTTDENRCTEYVMTNYVEGWWSMGRLERSAMVGAGADKWPLMAGEDKLVYRHETGWSGGEEVRDVYAESGALSLGAGARFMEIKQALAASGHGFNSIQARFYANRTPEGAEREFGPYTVRSDGYMDTRVSGRDIRMRLENTRDGDWSIGETRLDVAMGGGR